MISFPENWIEYEFGEFAEFNSKISLKKGTHYPFVPMENLNANLKYVSAYETKEYSGGGAKFFNGDTLFARITPCLENGKIAQVKNLAGEKGFGSTEYFIFRGRKNVSDSDFIFYLSKTHWFQQNAINSMVGASGRQRADAGFVSKTKLKLPSLTTQKKIAAILSAYDDLIENNLERIKLLEEMAQITYEEWFVRLKFPGHETTQMDPATGLPVGWEETDIASICYINANSLKSKDAPEKIKYIDISSSDTGFYQEPELLDFAQAPSRARRMVKFGDTIFSTVRPNRKTYSLILEDDPLLVASTGFAVLTPKIEGTFPFIYLTVANQKFVDRAVSVAGGAAYPAINQNDFEKIKIIKPDDSLIGQFSDKLINNFIVKSILIKQNQLLKEARDILLPRLMTGMIDVEQLVLPEPFNTLLPAQSSQTA